MGIALVCYTKFFLLNGVSGKSLLLDSRVYLKLQNSLFKKKEGLNCNINSLDNTVWWTKQSNTHTINTQIKY